MVTRTILTVKFMHDWVMSHFEAYEGASDERALCEIFIAEYGHNIARYGVQRAVKEWLLGLPSCLSIPFTYAEIGDLLKTTGLREPARGWYDCDFQDINYWNRIAAAIARIIENNTPVEKLNELKGRKI